MHTQNLLEVQERVEAMKTSFRVSHPSKKCPNYVSLMSSTIDGKHSSFEEFMHNRFGEMPGQASIAQLFRMMFGRLFQD